MVNGCCNIKCCGGRGGGGGGGKSPSPLIKFGGEYGSVDLCTCFRCLFITSGRENVLRHTGQSIFPNFHLDVSNPFINLNDKVNIVVAAAAAAAAAAAVVDRRL